eukprot:Clim_evm18s77 gene=Clim_evmTU18s77
MENQAPSKQPGIVTSVSMSSFQSEDCDYDAETGAATEVFSKAIADTASLEDIRGMADVQKKILLQFEKSNETLNGFLNFTESLADTNTTRLKQHTKEVKALREDMQALHERVLKLQRSVAQYYPEVVAEVSERLDAEDVGQYDDQ